MENTACKHTRTGNPMDTTLLVNGQEDGDYSNKRNILQLKKIVKKTLVESKRQ